MLNSLNKNIACLGKKIFVDDIFTILEKNQMFALEDFVEVET